MTTKIVIAYLIVSVTVIGQSVNGGGVDNRTASPAFAYPTGPYSSIPGQCSVPQTYWATDKTPPLYTCTAANTWSANIAGTTSANTQAIQGIAVSSTAPTDGQLFGYSATAGNWLPLSLAEFLDTRPLQTFGCKPPSSTSSCGTVTTSSPGNTVTIANLTGPGTLENIQFATIPTGMTGDPNGAGLDGVLTITRDGTQVLQTTMGLFCLMYGYQGTYIGASGSQFFKNPFLEVDQFSSNNMGCGRKIRINFSSTLVITLMNVDTTSGGSAGVFTGVDWRPGTPPVGLYNPRYNVFHAYVTPLPTAVSGTEGTVFTPLPTVTPGYPGVLDSISVVIYGPETTYPVWLEGHPLVTVDGVPGVTQYGTEDFFGCHFYCAPNPIRDENAGFTFLGTVAGGTTQYYTDMYRVFRSQPITFNSSLKFTMENGHYNEGPGSTVAINYGSLIIYYTTN